MAKYLPGTTGWLQEQRALASKGGASVVSKPTATGAALAGGASASTPAGEGNAVRQQSGGSMGSGYTPNSGGQNYGLTPGQGVTYAGLDGQRKQGIVTDDMGQTDYSKLWENAVNRPGVTYEELAQIAKDRADKASGGGAYNDYYMDQKQKDMYAYLESIKQPSVNEQWKNYQDEQAKIQAQQEAAARAKVEQAVNGLESQKTAVGQSYEDLMKQLYIDKRIAEKNLPQQMAAMGYTGGLAETSALNLQTGYRDAVAKGEQQRIHTLSEIDRAISDARLTGDISIAEQAAQLAQQGLLSYQDLVRAQQEQANWEKQYGFNRDQFSYQQAQDALSQENWLRTMSRQELLDQLSRDDISYDRKRQAAQYLYETTGDASGFLALGYTPEQVAAMGGSYRNAQYAARSGGAGTGKSLTAKEALAVYNNGYDSPEIREAIIGVYGDIFGDTEPVDVSDNAQPIPQGVLSELMRLEDTRNPTAAIWSAIQRYTLNGTITEEQARELLARYGMG